MCDYPGRVAAGVFTQGCNFRCGFCHNGGLIPHDVEDSRLIPQADVLARLAARAGFLDGVVISGGEPTLQPDLAEFCSRSGWRLEPDPDSPCRRSHLYRATFDARSFTTERGGILHALPDWRSMCCCFTGSATSVTLLSRSGADKTSPLVGLKPVGRYS